MQYPCHPGAGAAGEPASNANTNEEDSVSGPPPGSSAATRLGLAAEQIVLEYGYDDDVDEAFRGALTEAIGAQPEGEEYDGVVDVVLIWWRDGEGDLTDELINAVSIIEDGGFVLLATPSAPREDQVDAGEIEEAAGTTSLAVSGPTRVDGWLLRRLVPQKGSRR